jgi:RNA polymerase sigma-70 factor (ECF subfamily)
MRGIQSDDTPETVFDRKWAALSLDRALRALRAEYQASGRGPLAEVLMPYLTEHGERLSYRDAAEKLEMSEGAARVAVHRLRRRFGQILRRHIADTVSSPDEVDDEMREMLRVLGT